MNLNIFEITDNQPFQLYLLSDTLVKSINKEFAFYNTHFYRKEKVKNLTVCLEYPEANIYWYLDFKKYVYNKILKEDSKYSDEWNHILNELRLKIKKEYDDLNKDLENISAKEVYDTMSKYDLRDYQAFDLLQLERKMCFNKEPYTGLVLSEQRTGKTRVALAASIQFCKPGSTILIICPKSAQIGWMDEALKMNKYFMDRYKSPEGPFKGGHVTSIKSLKDLESEYYYTYLNIRCISYDLFKKLNITQLKQLINFKYPNKLFIIGDEVHRLRNFKTQQSDALFRLKDFCIRSKIDINILGVTGTPAVKDSYDIFGILSFINFSKISFQPYYKDFNEFKEYFYNCEDTSFGKKCKSLRRTDELNFLIKKHAVQTKQKELDLFKNYHKRYLVYNLPMDAKQKIIYDEVLNNMEFGDEIDCQNKLVQLTKLQQICISPKGLIADYDLTSPKLKWILDFTKKNKFQYIIMAKKLNPLDSIQTMFDAMGIKYSYINGRLNLSQRNDEIKKFRNHESQVFLIQLDVGKEALTLPEAQCTVFLDRDFAQGYNEQAEARMTPLDGKIHTKFIIDLVMKNSIEEDIYNTLVVRKESIDDINIVFKSKTT